MKKTILYLGIDPPSENSKISFDKNNTVIHYPIIKTIPRSIDKKIFNQFLDFTHLIFTSKTAVSIFFEHLKDFPFTKEEIQAKHYIAVGKNTASMLDNLNVLIAENETAEGVIDLLKTLSLKNSFLLWPHSALSRPLIADFLKNEHLNYQDYVLYDTVPNLIHSLPNFNLIDEIVFTSSSTVDAFFQFFPKASKDKILTTIGPITKRTLALKKKSV